MKKAQVKISVLGSSFTIQTDESPEYLYQVIGYLEKKIEIMRTTTSTSDALKVAILAGILVVDELFKERENSSAGISRNDAREAERITRTLIEKIDETLKNT